MKLEAMKAFAKDNGIKVSKKDADKPKALAKKIREKWEEDDVEMECECPECDEEIPDINTCPFCGSVFQDEEKEEETKKEKKEKKSDKKGKKKDEKKKKPAKKGPKAGGLNYQDAVEKLSSLANKAGYDVREKGNYTSYFLKGTRVFHIAKTTRTYSLHICISGLKPKLKEGEYRNFTKEEIESGHMATTVAMLKTPNLNEVVSVVKDLTALAEKEVEKKEKSKKAEKKTKTTEKPAKKKVKKSVKKTKSKKSKKKKKK